MKVLNRKIGVFASISLVFALSSCGKQAIQQSNEKVEATLKRCLNAKETAEAGYPPGTTVCGDDGVLRNLGFYRIKDATDLAASGWSSYLGKAIGGKCTEHPTNPDEWSCYANILAGALELRVSSTDGSMAMALALKKRVGEHRAGYAFVTIYLPLTSITDKEKAFFYPPLFLEDMFTSYERTSIEDGELCTMIFAKIRHNNLDRSLDDLALSAYIIGERTRVKVMRVELEATLSTQKMKTYRITVCRINPAVSGAYQVQLQAKDGTYFTDQLVELVM